MSGTHTEDGNRETEGRQGSVLCLLYMERKNRHSVSEAKRNGRAAPFRKRRKFHMPDRKGDFLHALIE